MKKSDLKYYLALNMVENAQPKALTSLLDHFDNIEELFYFDYTDVKFTAPERNIVKKIKKQKDYYINEAEKDLEAIDKDKSLSVITIKDKDYPELLKTIYDPPVVLYIKGRIMKSPKVAMVGSRLASHNGLQTAFDFANQLTEQDLCVVSGMALGIDTAAHKGALANKGNTIAVLGSGLFHIYPFDNQKLFEQIAQQGAVLSEFRLNQKPQRYNFPRRNRIVSGMSLGTVIVEAGNRSGALITASCALDQGREVFAIPGPLRDPHYFGTNNLIKQGAKLVEHVSDILEELNITYKEKKEFKESKKEVLFPQKEELTKKEEKVLRHLLDTPQDVEHLYKKVGMDISDLEHILMLLEIKGYADQMPGHKFRRIN